MIPYGIWGAIHALYPRHKGGEEDGLFVGGGGDLILHRVNQGHELIDLGDDAGAISLPKVLLFV